MLQINDDVNLKKTTLNSVAFISQTITLTKVKLEFKLNNQPTGRTLNH